MDEGIKKQMASTNHKGLPSPYLDKIFNVRKLHYKHF